MMPNYGCFVHLRDQANFNGNDIEIREKQEVSSLDSLTGKWNRRTYSFTTGDSTWAEFYRETGFRGSVLRVGPNTAISALKDFSVDGAPFGGAAQSIRVYDARPAGWTSQTEMATDRRRGSVMSDLRRASMNRKVRDLAVSMVGEIPTVGSYLSPLVSFLWPSGPTKSEIMDSIRIWASTLLHDVLENVTTLINANRIATLGRFVVQYQQGPSEANFSALYNVVLQMEADFTNQVNPGDNISALTQYGTVALAVHRLAAFKYDDIYKTGKVAGDKEQKMAHLKAAIGTLRVALNEAYEAALQARLKKITWDQPKSGSSSGTYRTRDLYTNYDRDFEYKKGVEKDGAAAHASSAAEHLRRYNAGPTFAAEFDIYREVADLWTYFAEPPKKGFVPPTIRVTSWMGMWGKPIMPPTQYSNSTDAFGVMRPGIETVTGFENRWDKVMQAPAGGKLNRIIVHGDKYVVGIEAEIDNKPTALWGRKDNKKMDVSLGSNQAITGVFGAWGGTVEHLSLRVQSNDSKGEPNAYPTEPGIGYSGNGNGFAVAGPDGGRGTLTGFFGQTINNDLQSLGTLWSYDRITPRA